MEKYFRLNALYDCYGALLTERQRTLMAQYLNEDLSLSEIAEREGISRQGVRDALKRAGEQLEEYESKLGFQAREKWLMRGLIELDVLADMIVEPPVRERIREKIRSVLDGIANEGHDGV